MKPSDTLKLIIAVSLALGLGSPLAVADADSIIGFSQEIKKPLITPPNWVFPIVWTFIYSAIGVAMALIWELPKSPQRDKALTFFLLMLGINFVWNLTMFGFQHTGVSLALLIALFVLIIILLQKFFSLRPTAGYLLIPYFLWRIFTIILSVWLFLLNH